MCEFKVIDIINVLENRCWSNWVNNDRPDVGSGDSERTAGICSNPSDYDCQTNNGLSMINVDVNKTTCTPQGITCRNSDQSGRCPDFKVRAKCPCSGILAFISVFRV